MPVLAICSLKGGVGKTSATLGLASAALAAGKTVTVVDLDPQGDSALSLGVVASPGGDGPATTATILAQPQDTVLDDVSTASAWDPDYVKVVPGSPAAVDYDGAVDPTSVGTLRPIVAASASDIVIIDCPPSLGALTMRGLAAADRAIVVAEPGLFSVTAAGRALQAIDAQRRAAAPWLQPLGVLVNRFRTGTSEHDYRLKELESLFGPLILSPVLPERTALQQAQGAGAPIHEWPGAAARELASGFDQIFARTMRAFSMTQS